MSEWQCAAVGSFLLWARWSSPGQMTFLIPLGDLFKRFGLAWYWCYAIELAIFLFLGTFIALNVAGAETCPQAFAAGLGWTGLAAQVRPMPTEPTRADT